MRSLSFLLLFFSSLTLASTDTFYMRGYRVYEDDGKIHFCQFENTKSWLALGGAENVKDVNFVPAFLMPSHFIIADGKCTERGSGKIFVNAYRMSLGADNLRHIC